MKTPSLFEVWGIEIEYAIVDRDSLDPRSIADEALRAAAGADDWVEDVDDGENGWSNELVSHVLELKNVEPVPTLDGLAARFAGSVRRLDQLLEKSGARLMPSAMHPWMNPAKDTRIWPHESGPIYQAYHRLFDCHRHGWANVQSMHLNLPFSGEQEFGRLMAAIRLVLPLIPALAASSPVVEGRATGLLDNRLDYYRGNSARVRSMTGAVVPEPVFGFDEYRSKVLDPITAELRAIDADPNLLDQEWTNARGAIARFDRMAVEIRVIDSQECPSADLAVAAAVCGAVRGLVEERWAPLPTQQQWPTEPLVDLLGLSIAHGPDAHVTDPHYIELFGADPRKTTTAGGLWAWLGERTFAGPRELEENLAVILREGTLAQRILADLGPDFDAGALRRTYLKLCECLAGGCAFKP